MVEKSTYKSFIVNGYVNKVTIYLQKWGLLTCLRIYLNGQCVYEVLNYGGIGDTHICDATQYFVPRRTEEGEKSNKITIEVHNAWGYFGWSATISAYMDIDVTGTLTETSAYKAPETELTDVSGIIGVFGQLMFMMMVMNLLMSMMSMFMGVFV
jgi:hypothetical protein